MRKSLFILLFVFLHVLTFGQLSEKKLDKLIDQTMSTFDVPGISVGIIKDGKIIYEKGRGLASLNRKSKMDKNTLVGIASNSKGFTCTALAILADEGKLNFNDKVSDYIPEFKMYDAYVSQEITIKDLVTHRAGLGLGQGDLMFFPEGGSLTIEDIVHNVRYLQPKYSFRGDMQYNNIMFIVAGEVIKRVSGMSWADFIEKKIMKPVGMTHSYGSYNRAINAGVTNIISAHAPVDGKAVQVPHDWNETANAAGGIVSNIDDMLTWANCLLNDFTTENGQKLVSDKMVKELWRIQTPMKPRPGSHFYGYGMGWFLSDVNGKFQVQHTGGLIGTVTQFTLFPELDLGIVVLTNQQSGAAFNTITNTIRDSYLGMEKKDWLAFYDKRMSHYFATMQKGKDDVFAKALAYQKTGQLSPNPLQYNGVYEDPWFGEVKLKGNRIVCKKSPRLQGILQPYSANIVIAKWDDRSYDADVFLIFSYDENGLVTKMDVKPISPITDFSFDFEDLNLKRKE